MVEEELKQSEVVGAEMAAKKKIAPQATVEILDQGTGSNRPCPHLVNRFTNLEEPAPQLWTENCLLLVAPGVARITGKHLEHPAQQLRRALKLTCQPIQVFVDLLREGEKLLPAVLQQPMDRLELSRAQLHAGLKFGHHEVVQHAALIIARTSHGKDVIAEPIQQQANVVKQLDRRVASSAGVAEPQRRAMQRLTSSLLTPLLVLTLFAGVNCLVGSALQTASG